MALSKADQAAFDRLRAVNDAGWESRLSAGMRRQLLVERGLLTINEERMEARA